MKMNFVLSTTCQNAMQDALLELVDNACKNKFEDFIVVAPETKTLFVERFLLDNIPNHAFTNISVFSFSMLLKKIQLKRVFPLSKEAGVMITRNLILNLENDLACYKKTAGTVGFAENIFETIQQLKSSRISPIELTEASKKCPTALRIKLDDIALIYDAYQNYLGEELIDLSDKLTMLEAQVELSNRIKNANMYVVGFDALTASASSCIKSFVKNAKSVTVSASFVHPDKSNAHIADNEVYEHLKAVALDLHINYNPKFIEHKLDGDFEHIKNNLYAYPIKKAETKNNIKLFSAPSFELEAKKVASLIKTDILQGKSRYRDNVIFLADASAREDVANALEQYEMPYFISSPYQFETHQLFVFIKLLFAIVRKNLDVEDVISLARNYLINIDADKVDDFENYCLKFGINHNKFIKPFVYKEAKEYQSAEEVRTQLISVVSMFSDVYSDRMTVKEIVDSLHQFFADYDISFKLESLRQKQVELGAEREAKATEQAYKKLEEVLAMLAQFLGEQKMDLEQFYTLLISGLQSADINLIPLGVDQIQVVENADGLYNVKNLYIVGASEGLFPIRQQDLGLVQDSEIISLENFAQKKIEPTIRIINRRERYKIYELLQLATNKLTISYSEHLSNGEEAKMSALMQMISGLFTDNGSEELEIQKVYSPFIENNAQDFVWSLGSKKVATNYLAQVLSKYKQGIDYEVGFTNIDSLYHALVPYMDKDTKNLFDNINSEEEESEVANAKELFFPKGTTSISQLERYFSCPFRHFADYGLRLKDRELASMKALDVGDILHEVAERFVNHYKSHRDFDVDKFAINVLNQVLSKEKYSVEQNRILVNILKSEVKRICNALFSELNVSNFVPTATEKWFGRDSQFAGVKLKSGVEVVGKIDRVDFTDDYYRIIDYKTGKIESSAEDIYFGRKLQLALYLSAIKDSKRNPAGVLYFPLRNEFAESKEKALESYRMKGFILNDAKAILSMDKTLNYQNPKSLFITPELKTSSQIVESGEIGFKNNSSLLTQSELSSMASYTRELAGKATEEIISGYVKATPYKNGESKACTYCKYQNVCGILSNNYKTLRESSLCNAGDFYKGGKSWEEK